MKANFIVTKVDIISISFCKMIKIIVVSPTNQKSEFFVEYYTTINELKAKIQDKLGYMIDQQILLFNNQPIQESNNSTNLTIGSCGIREGEEIRLEVRQQIVNNGIEIFVRSADKRCFPFFVYEHTTIYELKLKVQDKFEINADDQNLLLKGKMIGDENNNTIGSYGIQNGAELFLIIKTSQPFQIFIKTLSGKTIAINISPDERIETLKNIIYDKLNVPIERQKLIYGGKQLVNENTLKQYFIPNGATICLVLALKGGK